MFLIKLRRPHMASSGLLSWRALDLQWHHCATREIIRFSYAEKPNKWKKKQQQVIKSTKKGHYIVYSFTHVWDAHLSALLRFWFHLNNASKKNINQKSSGKCKQQRNVWQIIVICAPVKNRRMTVLTKNAHAPIARGLITCIVKENRCIGIYNRQIDSWKIDDFA